jgi:hypothetical protein
MKTAQSRTVAMSDMFRALAGCPEAQFDMIACTVYSAAYSIMLAGNKTQFNKLEADAAMYGTSTDASKTIRALFGIKAMNAVSKHFQRTYYAVSEALRQCGIPADMQKDLPQGKANGAARHAILDPLAQDYADAFTAVFTSVMIMPTKTDEERTAAAADREAKKAEKEAEAAKLAKEAEREERAKIDAEVKARVDRATEATEKALELATAPDTMARTVADMLMSGTLSADLEALLIEAAQARETALLLARAASAEPVPA